MEAPVWETGEWFRFALDYPSAGFDSLVFDVAVVDEQDDAWVLATDDRRVSKRQALSRELPFLGEFRKEDLGTKNSFAHWDWVFDFPLYHNKTWDAEMVNHVGNDVRVHPVVVTATYSAAIETHLGERPGFTIEARSEGLVFAEYDYVPAIGWFSHFYITPRSGGDWRVQLETINQGMGWSGSYYVHDAQFLMDHTNQFPGGQYDPFDSFTVADDAAFVKGGIFVWVERAAQSVRIVPPEGDPVEFSYIAPVSVSLYQESYEVAASGGTWDVETPGIGESVFVYLDAIQIWEERFEI